MLEGEPERDRVWDAKTVLVKTRGQGTEREAQMSVFAHLTKNDGELRLGEALAGG